MNILVVTGSRALSRTPAARVWALRELSSRIYSGTVDVVAHGACVASPDEWADDLAALAWINRVTWPIAGPVKHARAFADGVWRDMRGHERYPYSAPLERNAAMALWALERLRAKHEVTALSLRCDWPLRDGERATQGTAHCRDRLITALGAERVMDLVCPKEFGP